MPSNPYTTTIRGRAGAGQNVGQIVNPIIPHAERPGATLQGAPLILYDKETSFQAWPAPPTDWMASEEEWIVYWWFSDKEKWEEGKDFYYNGRIFVPFLNPVKDFTQADFIIPLGPDKRAGMYADYNAIVLDPFTEFTHDFSFDIERRDALADEQYLLIFLADYDVKTRTTYVITQALHGQDLSNRK